MGRVLNFVVILGIAQLFLILIFGLPQYPSKQQNDLETSNSHGSGDVQKKASLEAVVVTNLGNVTLQLATEAAPFTVANFVWLSMSGFYSGTSIYRCEKGFVAQGGAQSTKRSPIPPIRLEYVLPNEKYTLSMARTGDPNSATTDFFINLGDNSKWLGPNGADHFGYAVFGQIVAGFDVVDHFCDGEVRNHGPMMILVKPIVIQSIEIPKAAALNEIAPQISKLLPPLKKIKS